MSMHDKVAKKVAEKLNKFVYTTFGVSFIDPDTGEPVSEAVKPIEDAITKAVVDEQDRIIKLLRGEAQEYIANSGRCDKGGNTFGATMDISCASALNRLAEMIKEK